ncbi:hypothetical protein DAPPUDRAFT_236733 [Daphnia pulex]|uniref:Uncharacterized protein n=1 Tax=Daphnia pulex TaxID=6669 RepID=E9G2Z2_DAPPU|nr:hypothetical protein DAPPUDRAFT_236733 [Daphnia pulex]|eukprot:EFX86127.1 hypothetical protein DAPPUDRAFT_236733 [Daphnia pulex]
MDRLQVSSCFLSNGHDSTLLTKTRARTQDVFRPERKYRVLVVTLCFWLPKVSTRKMEKKAGGPQVIRLDLQSVEVVRSICFQLSFRHLIWILPLIRFYLIYSPILCDRRVRLNDSESCVTSEFIRSPRGVEQRIRCYPWAHVDNP